ncbi:MAG: isochorismatase family protein [Candidatus Harrisonbacteria bacterium]|nr:isochorismatase family protein [Candidatus Harrisonbacteria bacterium]
MKYEFIVVDAQNYFFYKKKDGKYIQKPLINFFQKILFPYLKKKGIKLNEIISDYRQPRPGDSGNMCHPGDWGYESVIPMELRKSQWIKCMNSPIWVRDNIGLKNKKPGLPYPDSKRFGRWIDKNIGGTKKVSPIIFGLTIDCCVLSTIQEFRWRGYKPIVIKEAVAHSNGSEKDKEAVLEKSAISWWANVLSWKDVKKLLN